jgi:hypothetical protein
MPDSYGYPTDEELERIGTWADDDPLGWFAFIKVCWWSAEWGWTEFDGEDDFKRPLRVFEISTGGWSGNESIVTAMQNHFILWSLTWQNRRRGGHYTFEVIVAPS